MHPPAATPWKVITGLVLIGALLFLTGLGIMAATGSGYQPRPVDLSSADAESAYAACQQFARAELKAPGPVTFAPIRDWRVRRYVDGRLRVRTDAEAVNAAGRTVALRVACRLRPLEDGRWELQRLSISTD